MMKLDSLITTNPNNQGRAQFAIKGYQTTKETARSSSAWSKFHHLKTEHQVQHEFSTQTSNNHA